MTIPIPIIVKIENTIESRLLFLIFFSCSTEDSEVTPTETIKYTVSITAGEGGAVSTNGGEYEKGTNLTISATANTGFEFEKWSDDNTDNPRVILFNSRYIMQFAEHSR